MESSDRSDAEGRGSRSKEQTVKSSSRPSALLLFPSIFVELGKRLLVIAACVLILIPPLPLRPATIASGTVGEAMVRYGDGALAVENGWVSLHLAGAPYEMGYQQGVLLGPQIRWLLAELVYPSLLDTTMLPHVARTVANSLPAEVREEAQGIADGAGITLADVVLLNIWPDLLLPTPTDDVQDIPAAWSPDRVLRRDPRLPLQYGIRPPRGLPRQQPLPWTTTGRDAAFPGSGFAVAAWDSGTLDNHLLLAGQLDAYPENPHPLLVERRPARGRSLTGVALPGWVGVAAGMNSDGITMVATRTPSIDRTYAGTPPFILVRLALERAKTGDEALRVLVSRRRTGGVQVAIADGSHGLARSVELTARQFRSEESGEPRLLVAALPGDPDVAELVTPATTSAWQRHHTEILERIAPWLRLNAGFIGRDALERLLIDTGARNGNAWVAFIGAPSDRRLWLAQPAAGMSAPAGGFMSFEVPVDEVAGRSP